MSESTEKRAEIIKDHQRDPKDVGSTEVQVALLTSQISHLTGHIKQNTHDFHSRRGLEMMVAKRRKLLKYFKANKLEEYKQLLQKLGLRDSY